MYSSNYFLYVAIFSISLVTLNAERDDAVRILGGQETTIRHYPYNVGILLDDEFICGGSILDEYNILTAAHCIEGNETSIYSVQYGRTNIEDGRAIEAENITIHENFMTKVPYFNDIAILHLKEALKLNVNAKPVILPPEDLPTPVNETVILTGRGLDTDGEPDENLTRIKMIIHEDEECEELFKDVMPVNISIQFCAGDWEGGTAQCSGDSGGPVVINNMQIGIVSWSMKPCGEEKFPGVNVRLSHYTQWIKDHMKHI